MIAKHTWFGRRKYTGWGVTPRTWQGWTYLAITIGALILFQSIPNLTTTTRTIGLAAWILFLFADLTPIMIKASKDEREKIHEAIAERNAAWTMSLVLALGLAGQAIYSAYNQTITISWLAAITLLIGVLVKAITNIYLEKKD